jgi:iron complex transport system substrate-binding protein
VSVGLNEQDAFFALGVAPVGVTDWMGFENGIGPWAQDAAKAAGDPPELLTNTDGIRFEKIAALPPDVTVALYSDLKESDYEKLSQIAPVVAPPDGHADFGIPWQETTRTVGQIVGETEEAEKLIGDLEARIAKAREEHPEFAGRSASMAMAYEGIWVYGPDDPRSRLLTDLMTRRASSSATACTPASTSTRRVATSSCSTPARTTRTTRSARRRC